jgi:azurin
MTPAAASDTQGRAIEIDANDTMKFSVNEIKAKPGESITVTLKNTGTLPKTAMGHNFVLLKSADAVQPFVTDSTQAGATDYIPESQKASIIAHTKLLGPGESDSVTFKAPDTAGSYPYLCSFPGHYQVGMKGELVVQ